VVDALAQTLGRCFGMCLLNIADATTLTEAGVCGESRKLIQSYYRIVGIMMVEKRATRHCLYR